MSVNDAVCCGAEPLFFLDYVAMPKDDPDLLEQIVSGIVDGCKQSGCALIGGETAIMSDVYKSGEYDLAGFCVGVAERSKIIDGKTIQSGDMLIGVESSGLHSNGFSLARKIIADAGLTGNDYVPELNQTVAEVFLIPTRIYVKCAAAVLGRFAANEAITGIAHITGGGLVENVSRILPKGASLRIDRCWEESKVFSWLQKLGDVEDAEMDRVFNRGIGLVFVVRPTAADDVLALIKSATDFLAWKIGKVQH
jgi:phosphoribosylformylglycinamidine cyclo-ligase